MAAAIRLAHSIGLHKRGSSFNLRPEEIEQRRRVYWIAYLVDKEYGALRSLISLSVVSLGGPEFDTDRK